MNIKLRNIVVAAVVLILASLALAQDNAPRYGPSAGNAYQLSKAQQQANWRPAYGMSAGNAYQLSGSQQQANWQPAYGRSAGNAYQLSMGIFKVSKVEHIGLQ